MKRAKIKLHLESLDVESFTASVDDAQIGTVKGNEGPTVYSACWSQCFVDTACCLEPTTECTRDINC